MNSETCRRPDTVCKLDFINKFNVAVSFQNLYNKICTFFTFFYKFIF